MASKKNKARAPREANPKKFKKKTSVLITEKVEFVDYKDVNLLTRFVSDRSKIRNRRVTGNSVQQQREIANAIKNRRRDKPLAIRIDGVREETGVRVSVEDNGVGFDPDFAIVAFNPGLITQSVLEPEKIGNVNFLNFAWIGNMARDQRVCYLWGDKVKTFEEMRARKGWNFGTTGVGVSNWVNFKTLQGLFDVDMKIITGFRGSGEQRIAIERGEVDGDCGSWSSISEDWIANNKITTVLKLSRELPPGAPNNVPYANDIAKNDADRAVLNVINGAGNELANRITTQRSDLICAQAN